MTDKDRDINNKDRDINNKDRDINNKDRDINNKDRDIKYLIFGDGFIGNKFKQYLGDESIIAHGRINIINDVYLQIDKYNPTIIINCIGKTGRPNVDWCENHKEDTFFSNVAVPTYIAEACNDTDIFMTHISSGCIYEGDKDFIEKHIPNFKGSFYSRTKIYSEQILNWYDRVLQIRIRMPIDNKPSPRNLITKLIGYKNVINISNSITYLPDLMKVAKELMDKKETGIFNVVNKGSTTHKELLELYKEIVDPMYQMPEFISLEELGNTILAGRSNCTLSTAKLEQKGIKIRKIKDAMIECMEGYAKYMEKK